MSFFNQLELFLEQAQTDNLKTKHFDSNFLGTKVKVSFGQGNAARIPWISFLIEPNKTSHGIYPVYLYYKEYDLLILAYGISETNLPDYTWNSKNLLSINDYFKQQYDEEPGRYGSSFIFKTYDLQKSSLDKETIDRDLKKIILEYTSIMKKESIQPNSKSNHTFQTSLFNKACKNSGLLYDQILTSRFVASLVTKPFVILTGLSGSGKTKMAQSFAKWISEDESQYCIVPVGADWMNREPLLGYVNALDPKKYIVPENRALQLMIEANKEENQDKPYFLILDEMNLSHVERYFADFLSVMESEDKFKLHSAKQLSTDTGEVVQSHYIWPSNLFVIGTVNIDETTYMFSPKVLDRANVIEFRVTGDEMDEFLILKSKEFTKIDGLGQAMGSSFVTIARNKKIESSDALNKSLNTFFNKLQPIGAEFGYRTANEIQILFTQLDIINPDYSSKDKENDKIDIAVMQKLLPKLHGSRSKLVDVLTELAKLCFNKFDSLSEEQQKDVFKTCSNLSEEDFESQIAFKISLEKIMRMHKNVIANGFTSYAEA